MVLQWCNMRKFCNNNWTLLLLMGVAYCLSATCAIEVSEKTAVNATAAATNKTAVSDSTAQHTDSRLLAALVPNHFKPAYVSPFSRPQFTQQLVPLIGASVKQKLREIVEDFDDGVEFLKNAFTIKEQFVKNIASNHLQKYKNPSPLLGGFHPIFGGNPKKYFPNMEPTIHTTIKIITKKPYYRYSTDGSILAACQSQFGNCTMMSQIPETQAFAAEMNLEGYKKFEKNVIRGLEKFEEKNVEATLGSLAADSNEIKGHHHKPSYDWSPSSVDYKKPEPLKKINVKSPLNTSVFSSTEDALDNHLHGNYHKKYPKTYKKPKAPAPVFESHSEEHHQTHHRDPKEHKEAATSYSSFQTGGKHGASYNSTIYYDSSTNQETKVSPPPKPPKNPKKHFQSTYPPTRKLKVKKTKPRTQFLEETRLTNSVVEKPERENYPPGYTPPSSSSEETTSEKPTKFETPSSFEVTAFEKSRPEKPKFEPLTNPKPKTKPSKRTQKTAANKRETAETGIRNFNNNNRNVEPSSTGKPFVDRVRVTGRRGAVKFDPSKTSY